MNGFASIPAPRYQAVAAYQRAVATVMRMVAAVRLALKTWRNRREFYRLGDMTDAELSDIGLTRADLHVAIAPPFGADPTSRLGAIASARIRTIEDGARLVS